MKSFLTFITFSFFSSVLFSQNITGNWHIENEEYFIESEYEEEEYYESAILHDKCLHRISLTDDGQITYVQYNTDDCSVALTKEGTYTYSESKLKITFNDMITLDDFYTKTFTVEFPAENKMTWTAKEEDFNYDYEVIKKSVISLER